ncbi:uncharacterized protein LOC134777215 [Penaeus indicus]|uniref:uncharacterized protein LOC134777215 n=1 Tax=Penaeus indicus TaxID=29960 RepID=UPI00300D1EEF
MKNAKATGPDEVPAEAWKSLGDDGVDLLWDLFSKIYDQGKMPNAWRESVIIPIYKEKGDIQEKTYDRVPRGEVWRCLRERNVSEKYIRLVQDMYEGATTQARSSVGLTEKFSVAVGLHQGSSLSPHIFDLIMDVLGQNIIAQPLGICCLRTT